MTCSSANICFCAKAKEVMSLSRQGEQIWSLTGPLMRLIKVCMQTLTITAAKKNLGRLLQAAAKGEDIGIISGADVIALRKVEIESTDYAQREYGVSPREVETFTRAAERRYEKLNRARRLTIATHKQLKNLQI